MGVLEECRQGISGDSDLPPDADTFDLAAADQFVGSVAPDLKNVHQIFNRYDQRNIVEGEMITCHCDSLP